VSDEKQIGSSLLSVEGNVIIAGLEAIALGWIFYTTATATEVWLPADFGCRWSSAASAVYSAYAMLAIVILGFTVEAVAGFLEEKLIDPRKFYKNTESPPQSSRTLLQSDQAYKDFSRRRLRILVARNTACCFAIFSILMLGCLFCVKCRSLRTLSELGIGLFSTLVFGYLWIDARKGFRNAIANDEKPEPKPA
jgi:hypothetical protein